jgi:hypothetical protein
MKHSSLVSYTPIFMLCSESKKGVNVVVQFSVLVTFILYLQVCLVELLVILVPSTRFCLMCSNMNEKYCNLLLIMSGGSVNSVHAWREMGLT